MHRFLIQESFDITYYDEHSWPDITRSWSKGYLIVNDILIGRYWPDAGPQYTLYLPGQLHLHYLLGIGGDMNSIKYFLSSVNYWIYPWLHLQVWSTIFGSIIRITDQIKNECNAIEISFILVLLYHTKLSAISIIALIIGNPLCL